MFKWIAMIVAQIFVLFAIVYYNPAQADHAAGGVRSGEAKFITSHGQGLNKKEIDRSRLTAVRHARKTRAGRNYSRSLSFYAVRYSELDMTRSWVFMIPPLPKRQQDK